MEELKKWTEILLTKVKQYYGSRETIGDSIVIGVIILIMTYLPSTYNMIPRPDWRVLFVLALLGICLGLLLYFIRRLLKRHKIQKFEKENWIHLLERILILCIVLTVVVILQVKILYPSFSGIAVIQLSGKETLIIWIVQSIFFALYSQALVSACFGIENSIKEWLSRLVSTYYKSFLPLVLLSFLTTAGIQAISNITETIARCLSVILTTFLWITVIVIQERSINEN